MLLVSREPGKPIIIHNAVLLQVFRVEQGSYFLQVAEVAGSLAGSFVIMQYVLGDWLVC